MKEEWIVTEWSHKEDFENQLSQRITIHRMNSPFYDGERYCVRYGQGLCLNTKLNWEFEPIPSSRDGEFYERCRFNNIKHVFEAADKARKDFNSVKEVQQ